MCVTDFAKCLGLHKSVAYRLVKSLQSLDWVRMQPNRKYVLSLRVFEVGSRIVSRMVKSSESGEFAERMQHLAKPEALFRELLVKNRGTDNAPAECNIQNRRTSSLTGPRTPTVPVCCSLLKGD